MTTLKMPRRMKWKNRIARVEYRTKDKCLVKLLDASSGEYREMWVSPNDAPSIVREHRRMFPMGSKTIARSRRTA